MIAAYRTYFRRAFFLLSAVSAGCAPVIGSAQAKVVGTAVACPLTLPAGAPKNTTVLGNSALAGAPLWSAVVALGDTAETAVTYRKNPANFALAEIESDQAENGDGPAAQKDGTLQESYTYRATKSDIPGKMTGFMLACRYAKNYRDSLAVSKSSALLLMQVPVTTGGVCVSTSQKPVGNAARPLKSAICTGK